MTRRVTVSWIVSLSAWWGVVCLGLFLMWPRLLLAESRSWKYLSELSEEERRDIDPRTDTPRDTTLPYLPAEPYPFTPPYTAEEMGFRSMEFPHIARWNFVQIEDYGSLMHTGYLFTNKEWSEEDRKIFFSPGFMRREWFMEPLKNLMGLSSPEEFYLRPRLDVSKFPQERKIDISPELAVRIDAQERAGHLVF